MKPKMIAKLSCDVLMTAALLLLMAYEMVGQAAHEWIGIGMFLLFLGHHSLNLPWSKHIFRGKYTAFRVLQAWIVGMLFLCMIGLAYSGIILSRHVFTFLPINGGRSLARTLHMLCAYWGFAFMSIHLGLHWKMIIGIARRGRKNSPTLWKALFHVLAIVIAGYGFYAFFAKFARHFDLWRNLALYGY